MKIRTKAVHAGDRRHPPTQIPVTTPVYTAASYISGTTAELDRIFAREQAGYSYARYENPTNRALEELAAALENGRDALACASGMAALHIAILAALTDRRRYVLAASALYGATYRLLWNVLEPLGIESSVVDICDPDAVARAIAEHKPGCVLMETISNPLLRVGPMDRIAGLCREAGCTLVVDNTFATPLLVRPIEQGAAIVMHSATKYLAGHGDVLGGLVVAGESHAETLRALSRTLGPVMGPFEAYLTTRGIKTFAVRMERQCANARRIAAWLRAHPKVDRVFYPDEPTHPDAAAIGRLLPEGLYGAMVSFELKSAAGREDVFAFMDRLRLIVRATSLGDVHTMILYPAISSHRDIAPKQRERMGIRDNLVRVSAGIEDVDDILADLDRALE